MDMKTLGNNILIKAWLKTFEKKQTKFENIPPNLLGNLVKRESMNHVEKYYWIIDHPRMGAEHSQSTIELTPQKVNPFNNIIEKDTSLNTKYQWWVEVTHEDLDETTDEYVCCHDWDLDTGGDTAEEAIEKLYNIVKAKYGDY